MITVLIMGATVMTARGQSGFETEPVLKAKDLVAPELLKGPHFTVDDRVPVKGFLAYFTIRSDYGTFEAHGIHMFQIRVKEVYALAEAATAPGASGGQKVADVSERVGGITVTALGYQKERPDLAKGLGVDPYTTNPVLSKELSDMAWVAFSGRFGIQAAMSVLVPYSMAMSAVTITNTTVYDTPQGDLINKDQAIFAETGASEAQVQALMKNKQYSLSVLTALAQGLQRLQGVNGLASVVDFAAAAKTQDETRFVAGSVNILARYHESVAPIAVTTAPGPIIGRTTNGTLVIPAAVDYVAWTERVGRMAPRDDFKAPDRTTWLSGQMSTRARKEFTARGWEVEESFSIAAER